MQDFPAFSCGLISRCRTCLPLTDLPCLNPGNHLCFLSPTTIPVSMSGFPVSCAR
ncbi:hypothetical protein LDENG_00196140 [Lucifuga dentata]|nr:hypothetical protein LDENG_00196140 [Lucifuga dentata]